MQLRKESLIFFRLSFRNCISCVNNCEDLLYTYLFHVLLGFKALKLASTFVLALVEEKLTSLDSFYFSAQIYLKILAKQRKTAKMRSISLMNISWLFVCQSENRKLRIAAWLSKSNIYVFIIFFRTLFYAIASLVIFYTDFHENVCESTIPGGR